MNIPPYVLEEILERAIQDNTSITFFSLDIDLYLETGFWVS